jgi:transposase InsO family protein
MKGTFAPVGQRKPRNEYISHALLDWAEEHGTALAHIQLGQPQQNAYIEGYGRHRPARMARPIHHHKHRRGPALCHTVAMDLQERPAEYAHQRYYPCNETKNGCANFTILTR